MESLCKICGAETKTFIHPKTQMVFHKCPSCEFISKDEKHYLSLDEEKIVYDLHENSLENAGYVNYLQNFIDQAVYPFIKSGSCLDFGSGPEPVLSELLKRMGYDVDIYDYFFHQDKSYESKTYDLITATEVVEHLQDPLFVFKHLKEHLKPNGLLPVMTLFYPKDINDFYQWWYIRDQSHVSFFSEKTMSYIAKLCDLNLIFHNAHRVTVFKKI